MCSSLYQEEAVLSVLCTVVWKAVSRRLPSPPAIPILQRMSALPQAALTHCGEKVQWHHVTSQHK